MKPTHRNIADASAHPIHPAIVQASLAAHSAVEDVAAAAADLSRLLSCLHGGKWHVDINHMLGYVLIMQQTEAA